ncbi:hypothetical protein HPB50_013472 [Hyalomma asiaticum]|uniref:Uncharacterized protein n=1 Tax=Hyalomma asiaticum TaxID=266040 RepID=A0ACB7SY36_HYAAI|nr:hypothetical protein HPB50_013472 [Hyalomma asiaticum]
MVDRPRRPGPRKERDPITVITATGADNERRNANTHPPTLVPAVLQRRPDCRRLGALAVRTRRFARAESVTRQGAVPPPVRSYLSTRDARHSGGCASGCEERRRPAEAEKWRRGIATYYYKQDGSEHQDRGRSSQPPADPWLASAGRGCITAPVEYKITVIHAIVLGPEDTPYEGGFFHFLIQCPPDYPIKPPRVRLMNTDGGRVRFNPNLYACGKVCLSILGTWDGPAWSPAQCLSSVLISIQSLLTENPYFNEPGFKKERQEGDSERYNTIVQHETIRVAVCDAVEACLKGSSQCPAPLREVMLKSFLDYYPKYEKAVQFNVALTCTSMRDPFGSPRGTYEYETLLRRLRKLKKQVEESLKTADEEGK